jgi:hypothetical protein
MGSSIAGIAMAVYQVIPSPKFPLRPTAWIAQVSLWLCRYASTIFYNINAFILPRHTSIGSIGMGRVLVLNRFQYKLWRLCQLHCQLFWVPRFKASHLSNCSWRSFGPIWVKTCSSFHLLHRSLSLLWADFRGEENGLAGPLRIASEQWSDSILLGLKSSSAFDHSPGHLEIKSRLDAAYPSSPFPSELFAWFRFRFIEWSRLIKKFHKHP